MATTLIVPFIALCFLIPFTDGILHFIEGFMRRKSWLPNEIGASLAYMIASGIAFLVCWRGHFIFWTHLGMTFNHDYEGWFFTASLLGAGSGYVRQAFKEMRGIPQVVSNVYSTGTGSSETTSETISTAVTSDPNSPP